MFICAFSRFYVASFAEKKKWLNDNFLIIIFLFILSLSMLVNGTLKGIIGRCVLVALYGFVFNEHMFDVAVIKNKIIPTLVYINGVANILSIFFGLFVILFGHGNFIGSVLKKITFLKLKHFAFPLSLMYSNPNSMGVMTGIALLCACACFKKSEKQWKNLLFFVYVLFSICCICISKCRSAQLACICVMVAAILTFFLGNAYRRKFVFAAFSVAVVICSSFLLFIYNNENTGLINFTPAEQSISRVSSGRYFIWKSGYYTMKNRWLWGVVNTTKERDEYQQKTYPGTPQALLWRGLSAHNGYFDLLFTAGVFAFIVAYLLICKKIVCSLSLSSGLWFLCLIYSFVINLFETMFFSGEVILFLVVWLILSFNLNEDISRCKKSSV